MIYARYKNDYQELWNKIRDVIDDMERSGMIRITTDMEYVIGYIIKNIVDNGFNIDRNKIEKILEDLRDNLDLEYNVDKNVVVDKIFEYLRRF